MASGFMMDNIIFYGASHISDAPNAITNSLLVLILENTLFKQFSNNMPISISHYMPKVL